jgi:L-ascorbate metabolism protein UlaG (beta-lactamase superfamily)
LLRRAEPLEVGSLDDLDAVLISHIHYDHLDLERLGAAEQDDTLPEQRVGEEADAVQLDEDGRVSDPTKAVAH